MAATPTAMYSQNGGSISVVGGASVPQAWPNVGGPAQNFDLLQIIDAQGNILVNVDYLGAVHKPASNPTRSASNGAGQTLIGQFKTYLTSAASTAQLFAAAFSNPSQLDIIQVIVQGGNVPYYLDYLGVAHGS
jgi:hypothetical protein